MSSDDFKLLLKKIFALQPLSSLPAVAVAAVVVTMALDVPFDAAMSTLWVLLPLSVAFSGVIGPYFVVRSALTDAFLKNEGEPPEGRIARILRLPRLIELQLLALHLISGLVVVGGPAFSHGRGYGRLPLGLAAYVLVMLPAFVWQGLKTQELIRPHALELFQRHPRIELREGGLLWTRQSWYLPYTFILFIVSAIFSMGLVVARKYQDGAAELQAALAGTPHARLVQDKLSFADGTLIWPLLAVGGYILAVAALSAWALARNQRDGTRAVQQSIESLASGRPELPRWISTDETGDLSRSAGAVFEQLRTFSSTLRQSASQLGASAEQLGESSAKQNEVLVLQAAAIQETQVTAQEIKQTSLIASQKAEAVLNQTQRANEISEAGEQVIEQSLQGLVEIRQEVKEMETRISALAVQARQIGHITTTVKDLADQSNMLALNAAIEAVRAGEHGKGFGVVAREIRALADQSIQSTRHVGEILDQIVHAIAATVTITERGAHKVGQSVEQVRNFGENIRQMAGIVRDNATAVRQISAAVAQQNAGIHQISQAVTELSRMMEETTSRVRTTEDAAKTVQEIAGQVASFGGSFGAERLPETKDGAAPTGTSGS
ncbi:MAG TPA: methyl-accepting chemotaxis protein [Myxococcaceae bacterium]|nr:methyl-accepting chemotaxis protein [Myxococcaceae bacterium]